MDQATLWTSRHRRYTAPPRDSGHCVCFRVVTSNLTERAYAPCMSRKELELDTCLAYQLINKWDPCTRTIISLMCVPPEHRASEEEDLEHAARNVADDICANPSAVSDPIGSGMADSAEPGIFFVRPLRPRGASGHCGHINLSRAVANVPTPHLLAIFKRSLQWIESKALFASSER